MVKKMDFCIDKSSKMKVYLERYEVIRQTSRDDEFKESMRGHEWLCSENILR
jgi:hypothetical protein